MRLLGIQNNHNCCSTSLLQWTLLIVGNRYDRIGNKKRRNVGKSKSFKNNKDLSQIWWVKASMSTYNNKLFIIIVLHICEDVNVEIIKKNELFVYIHLTGFKRACPQTDKETTIHTIHQSFSKKTKIKMSICRYTKSKFTCQKQKMTSSTTPKGTSGPPRERQAPQGPPRAAQRTPAQRAVRGLELLIPPHCCCTSLLIFNISNHETFTEFKEITTFALHQYVPAKTHTVD